MQTPATPTQPQPAAQRFIAIYGLFILSCIVLIMVAVAWFTHNVDQTTAIGVIGAILTGNGLVTATQWQAAPGLVGSLQAIIEQFAAHIQVLHQQIAHQSALPAPIVSTNPGMSTAAPATATISQQKQGG